MEQANGHSLNPVVLWRLGFDWQGRSRRLQYLIYLGCCLIVAQSVLALKETRQQPEWVIDVGFVLMALLVVPLIGHGVRRLADMGRSGWWYWLNVVPILGILLHVTLLLARSSDSPAHPNRRLRRVGFGMALGVALLMLSRLVWAPYWIPSGAMKPTLLVGDVLIASRLRGTPVLSRGDVVIFRHPVTNQDWNKRIIALPGESVQVRGGIVHVDGAPLSQSGAGDYVEAKVPQGPERHIPRCANAPVGDGGTCLKHRLTETTPEGRSYFVLDIGPFALDDTPVFTVPEGHYFVLGDNRDNSTDSRFSRTAGGIGMVPAENITARVRLILFSSRGKELWWVWTWAPDRFMKRVQ